MWRGPDVDNDPMKLANRPIGPPTLCQLLRAYIDLIFRLFVTLVQRVGNRFRVLAEEKGLPDEVKNMPIAP